MEPESFDMLLRKGASFRLPFFFELSDVWDREDTQSSTFEVRTLAKLGFAQKETPKIH